MNAKSKQIYLAGPDVFRPDAVEFFQAVAERARILGLLTLSPLDNALSDDRQIWQNNIDLIRRCDAVVANLNAFRGSEPDSGTVFEVGYAFALGKPVVGYLLDHSPMQMKAFDYFADRGLLPRNQNILEVEGRYVFPDGLTAESWNYPVNLMLQHAAFKIIRGSVGDALRLISEI